MYNDGPDSGEIVRNNARFRGAEMADAVTVCSACSARLASSHSFAGVCETCGASICFRCWSVGERRCRQHQDKSVDSSPAAVTGPGGDSAKVAEEGAYCSRCSKPVDKKPPRGGVVYCLDCQKQLVSPPDLLPAHAVTADAAAYLEMLFQRHVADAVRQVDAWPGRRRLPFRSAKAGAVSQAGGLPEDFAKTHPCGQALQERLESLPRNEIVEYEILYKSRVPWRRGRRLDLAVASYAPLEPLAERGFVSAPAGSKELTALVRASGAAERESLMLLAFSPTGWGEIAAAPDRVALVSLGEDGAWRVQENLADAEMKAYVSALLGLRPDREAAERCRRLVEETGPEQFPLSAREVAHKHELPLHLVAETFRGMSAPGGAYVMCDDSRQKDWLLELK